VVETGAAGAAPAPAVVEVSVLQSEVFQEAWEGVLVRVVNVRVSSVNPDAPGDDLGEWMVSDGLAEFPSFVRVGDLMTARPDGLAAGDCYASVTGPLQYDGIPSAFKIEPRSAADLVAGGTCP
jgi:hypothetical protein